MTPEFSEGPSTPHLVVVSGLAGAGKSVAIRALEDLGYHCVDNLPAVLLESFVDKIIEGSFRSEHIAIALDSRDRDVPLEFEKLYPRLSKGCKVDVLFLEAREEVVLKRFRETRRLHPLTRAYRPEDSPMQLQNAIRLDAQVLAPIRIHAMKVVDTSEMSANYLRQLIRHYFAPANGFSEVLVNIVSFGFKYGVPHDLETMFDVRCFPNPHYVDELRPLTGLSKPVQDYVFSDPKVLTFIEKVKDLMLFLYPLYRAEGKSYLGIGIGCTGGKHRSVAIVERLAQQLRSSVPCITVEHRHFDRE